MDTFKDALKKLTQVWLKQIERARQAKQSQFGTVADRAWKFYGESDHKFLFTANNLIYQYSQGQRGIASPPHPIAVNMVSEYCRMMLPFVHAKNPARVVSPRRPSLPPSVLDALAQNNPPMWQALMQQRQFVSTEDEFRAHMLRWLLNYTPELFDLGGACRQSVTEGLVTGMGVVWTQMVRGLPVTVFDSQNNLLWDPDAEQQRDCAWVVRLRSRPAYAVSEEFGIPANKLKGAYDSYRRMAEDAAIQATQDSRDDTGKEESGDVVQYYEIYSRMGIGQSFHTAGTELRDMGLDSLGPHVFLVVMPGVEYPLNYHPDHVAPDVTIDEIKTRLTWPIAFWGNEIDPWPCTTLEFLKNPRQIYPTSPLAEALPLQEFLDYLWSQMMSRVVVTMRDIICTSKALDKKIRDAILSGGPLSVVAHDQDNSDIAKYFHVLQLPTVNQDTWRMAEFAQNRWRESTGLMELMYGSSGRQMRSSAEVQIKQQNMSTRPEDMADQVEAWHCRIASKEAVAARLHTQPQRFAELAGEPSDPAMPGPLAQAWGALVNTPDPIVASDQMSYTVEAGSGRKPNPQKEVANVTQLFQTAMPMAMQMWQMGNPALLNGLWHLWGKANQMDTTFLMVAPPPQPQPQQGPPQQQPQPQQ